MNEVLLEAGSFRMGNPRGDGYPSDGETPVHAVTVGEHWIDVHAVSNDRFAEFVDATGHVSEAERFGTAFVFAGLLPDDFPPTQGVVGAEWWRLVEGADWRHPDGPQSDLEGRGDHPVVQVSWNDAQAYCAWAGRRLPTEAEWERAARGGVEGAAFPWGDELEPGGEHRMNVWQGQFPTARQPDDGWYGTAPVDAFTANGFGLHNTTGNVWELCHDWFAPDAYVTQPGTDPKGPSTGQQRVMRGGSYLCHASYCRRYRVDARSSTTPDSASGNVGFRTVRDA